MISNERRQEAVENLRSLSEGNRVRYKEEFYDLLDETVMPPFTGYHEMNDVFGQLADLIDRDTCHDIDKGFTFHCSKCGCELDLEDKEGEPTMWFGGIAQIPNYCPWCGAEVINGD